MSSRGILRPILRWTVRIVLAVLLLILALAVAGCAWQRFATARDARAFPAPGRLVEVEGRRLHLLCRGEGAPAVVLDAPLGGSALGWSLVQPEVAGVTRVCAFDRAGYGWSDPGPAPRTSGRVVSELREALRAAGVPPPYVLVGASIGGCNMRLFAARHPGEVAGLVLVDSAHEDQLTRMPASANPSASELRALDLFRVAARLGILRLAGMPIGEASMDFLPRELRAPARAAGLRVSVVDAIRAETSALPASFAEVREAVAGRGRPPFGDLPLVVLTHEEAQPPTGEEAELYRVWLELQAELKGESSRGRQVIVRPSGHFIAVDQPAQVASAILSVVTDARAATRPPGTPPAAE
jgi:pimeloyl-ACP methyl ester carboxylesterase